MAVALTANLVLTGTFEVAMPDLAGALLAARRRSRAPSVTVCRAYLLSAAGAALIPYLGGLPGACAAILLLAVCSAFGDIILITLLQQWAPPNLVGRVMSMIMLASMGAFPLSVAVSGFLVHRFGAVPFFPAGAIVMSIAVLGALSRREIRALGMTDGKQAEQTTLAAAG